MLRWAEEEVKDNLCFISEVPRTHYPWMDGSLVLAGSPFCHFLSQKCVRAPTLKLKLRPKTASSVLNISYSVRIKVRMIMPSPGCKAKAPPTNSISKNSFSTNAHLLVSETAK